MNQERLLPVNTVDGRVVNIPESEYFRITGTNIDAHVRYEEYEEKVYARLIEDPMDESEMEEAKLLLYLEIYTLESITAAYEHFANENNSDQSYKPISCVFTVNDEVGSLANQACTSIKEQSKKNQGWLKGKLTQNNNSQDGVVGHVSLTSGEPLNGELSLELDLKFIPENLSAEDENLSNLKKALNIASELSSAVHDIPDQVDGLPPIKKSPNDGGAGTIPYTVTVYKVGNANAIAIQKNGKCVLFDCGKKDIPFNSATQEICNIKPDILIISHWHVDHYSLLDNANFDFSNLKLVIFPLRLNNKTQTFDQVILKLAQLKQNGVTLLQLIPSCPFPEDFLSKFGFDRISLYLGENQSNKQPKLYGYIKYDRAPDDSGILMSIRSCTDSSYAILPGDCSYYSWPQKLAQQLINTKYLVVPHHGGHVITRPTPSGPSANVTQVFISTNRSDFKDLDSAPLPESNTKHKSFIDASFHNHVEHITSLLSDDKISFQI